MQGQPVDDPSAPPSRPSSGLLGVAITACLAGAVAAALLDVVIAAARAGDPVAPGALLRALLAAIALYALVGLACGIGAGVVAVAILTTLPPGAGVTSWRRALAGDGARDAAHSAGLLATAAAALLLGGLVFGFARRIGLEMASKRNGALSTALVAVAGLPIAALAWFPLFRLLRRPARLLPRPRAVITLAALLALALAAVVAAVLSVDWRIIDFGPLLALLGFAALTGAHLWFWRLGPGRALAARLPLFAGRGLGVAGGLGLVVALVGLAGFGDEPRSRALIGEETAGARPLLRIARRLADRDGDGFAARFGGGDCDDRRADVYPGADEIPGNGVDEDCSGSDLQGAVKAPPVTPLPPASRLGFSGNLLVVTIDTLRADRLDGQRMPRLSALAATGARFTHAYAQAPNTPRSFPSFLTSRYPSQVAWVKQFARFSAISDENTTFFEVLRAAGLRTVGVFSHFYMVREHGITQGFDEWDDQGALTLHDSNTDIASPRIATRVVKRLGELAATRQRFALWTHLFDPHSRYMEHPEFPVRGSGARALEEKYDGEVSFTDRQLGRILDGLAAAGLAETTAVVVFADHGESFGEHKEGGQAMYFHGETLYDEVLRVPLVLRVPGLAPREVADPVMLIDLGPTLCDLVSTPVPPSFRGRSLVPALRGERLDPRPVYAELLPDPSWNHSARVLITDQQKLLYKLSENTLELYDLAADPREQKNLANQQATVAGALKEALLQRMAEAKRE